MKNIFGLLALLVTGSLAATSALYLHHERSTQATVEADCQNREVCLDKINLAPIGRFNDGTLWHGVTQEKPNVNLTGTLTVTGATVLSNNLTLSLFATGRIPYTTTAGLLTSGTGLTYNGSAFSVTGTAAISGVTTLTGNAIVGPTGTGNPQGETADLTITAGSSGNVVSSLTMRGFRTSNSAFANYYAYHGSTMVGKTQWLRDGADDAGSWKLFTMPTAGAITERLSVNSIGDLGFNVNKFTIAAASGNTTIAGTLGVTGVQSNNEAIAFVANGTTGAGRIFKDATNGLVIRAVTGSSRDFQIQNAAGTVAMQIPVGATTVQFPNDVQFTSGTGASFTTAPNFVFGTASTALALDGSKNVISVTNTGTGNNVLSASPTLTGTITASALTTSGAITANGGITSVASVASSFYETGTFTMSLSGFSACTFGSLNAGKCEATASFVKVGKVVSLLIPQMYGTSNATTMDVAGIPATIQVATGQKVSAGFIADNGNFYACIIAAGQNGASAVTFQNPIGTATSTFTAAGNKGFSNATTITYTTF